MSTQMKKMLIIVSIVLGIVFGWYVVRQVVFWLFVSFYELPAVTISATVAQEKTWQSYLSSVGTLTAVNGVDISAEAPGIVKEIRFNSGEFVKQGDILLLLDTSVEEAELKSNQAQLSLNQINFDRNKTLFQKNVIPKSVYDTSLAQLKQAQSSVDASLARIKQKTITAPFSGKIGIRLVDLGQYLPAGTAMVALQSLDPLYVRFNLPEQFLRELYLQQPIEITVTMNGAGKRVVVGTLTAINSKVDQSTRNILVEATIPNKDLQLYPGMFALVKVWLREKKNVITLPQTSISYSLHGDSVFLIVEKGKHRGKPILYSHRQYVQVGERRGDEVSILKGIKPGDTVATSGQLKLQNDTHVVIDNSVEL